MHAIDLSPIVNAVIGILASGIAGAGYWAIRRVRIAVERWLGAKLAAEMEALADAGLQKAVSAGAAAAETEITEKGWAHPHVKSTILAFAAPWFIARFPAVLRHWGLDANNPAATRDFVMHELDRVFPTAIAPIANSPVTPPVGIPAVPSGPGVTTKTLNDEELAEIARQQAAEAPAAQA